MDLTNGPIWETDEKITVVALQETSCPLLGQDAVLVAMYGGFNQIGRTGITTQSCTINQAISALVLDVDRAEPYFVLYWLNSNVLVWRRIAASSRKDPNITKSDVEAFPVLLPPLPEQRKIAAILSTWDEAIGTVERLIAGLEQRKQGLMQRLLTGAVRFEEFVGEEWRTVQLGDVLKPISRPETVQVSRKYRLIGVRWYLQGAHIHDVVPGNDITAATLNRIRRNDVLYNKMWVSKHAFAVAKTEHDGAFGTNEYPQFKCQSGVQIDFLEQAFHNPRFLHDATAMCRGTTGRIRLHPNDFLQLTLKLPRLEEQRRIAEVLGGVDEEIKGQKEYLASLHEQKKGLMQRLLTGEVRVAL